MTEAAEKLLSEWLGSPPSWWWPPFARLDWEWTRWVLRRAISDGEHMLSPRYIVFRCRGCQCLLTPRGMQMNYERTNRTGCPVCGSTMLEPVNRFRTHQVAITLLYGR